MRSGESKGGCFFFYPEGETDSPIAPVSLYSVVGRPESQVGCDLRLALNVQVVQPWATWPTLAGAALPVRLAPQSSPLMLPGSEGRGEAPTILAAVLNPG